MNDEEKYKKALEKAKALYGSSEPMSGCSVILEIIFPELNEDEDEDEKVRKAIINAIHNYAYRLEEKIPTEWFAWLEKQARQKYTQKDVDYAYLKGVNTTKRMFEKQQKSAWSEEDEQYVKDILALIIGHSLSTHSIKQVQVWLQSLKGRVQPQNQWKPSDEQMDTLWFYTEQNNYAGAVLTSLYNDLKKLKEE